MYKYKRTFKTSKPCEFVHTEKIRFIFHQIDGNFWMVMVNEAFRRLKKFFFKENYLKNLNFR